ncbi:MAG: hypothetical protein JWM78_1660 [Verrucomicrobiaceae bacterium]|nr:hypothetical protein [Verrucomicrobiaceae bacterium]
MFRSPLVMGIRTTCSDGKYRTRYPDGIWTPPGAQLQANAADVAAASGVFATGGGTDLSQILLHKSFEGGTLGANISTVAPVSSTGGIISADRAMFGSRSARDDIAAGQAGGMGWYWEPGDGFPRIAEGEEIWMRLAIWIPVGANLAGNIGTGLKFFRFRQKDSGGTIQNYQDLYYVCGANGAFERWRTINENSSPALDVTLTTDPATALIGGQFNFVELHLKAHSVAASGRIQLWVNGVLVADNNSRQTLAGAGWSYFQFLLLTYWNQRVANPPSGAGPDVPYTFYYDQWSCAVKTASRDDTGSLALDPAGNRFIGTAVL